MKKLLTLIVVLALSAIVLSASAQLDLPPIDKDEAADLLGRWYMFDLCSEETCVNFPELGITLTYDVNPDNTIVVGAETDSPSVNKWFIENGKAYTMVPLGENNFSISEFGINENGLLVAVSDSGYVTYTREEQSPAVSEAAVTDAGMDKFAGEWHIKGFMNEGELVPSSLIGTDTVLTIKESTWTLSDGLVDQETEFILEEGKLYSVIQGTDNEGNAWEEYVTMEYHDDGSLFMYFDPDTEEEFILVFTRDKNVYGTEDVVDAISTEGNAEGTVDAGSFLDNLLSDGEGGIGFSSLIQQFLGGGETELSGLIQQLTGSENIDFNSMLEGLMSGSGEGFSFGGLLDGLTGGSEGEGSFNLSGLMNMFGLGE